MMQGMYNSQLSKVLRDVDVTKTTSDTLLKSLHVQLSQASDDDRAHIQQQIDEAQVDRASADQLLCDFLLTCAPFLHEHQALTNNNMDTTHVASLFNSQVLSSNCSDNPATPRMVYQNKVPNVCIECKAKQSFIDSKKDASFVCTECGCMDRYGSVDGPEGLPYAERVRMPSPPYTYKPIIHFVDLLNQKGGDSRQKIPGEIYLELRVWFKSMRIKQSSVSPMKVRAVLRKMGKSKYYEDVYAICKHLNPTYVLVNIPHRRKVILRNMFCQVYALFRVTVDKIAPKRKNFLSYPYVAFKFCEYLGWYEYFHMFPLLKSREKLRMQDKILRAIFSVLGWAWTATV